MVGVVWKRTSLRPPATGLARGRWHVADRHLVRRHERREVKRCLVIRLVPVRNEATSVRRLELREQRPGVHAFLVLVVECEKTVRLGVDLARVGQEKPIVPGLDDTRERYRRGLRGRIGRDFATHTRIANVVAQAGRGEGQVGSVEGQRRGRLDHLQLDLEVSVEGQPLSVRCDRQEIVMGNGGPRQLRRQGCIDGVGLRRVLG